MFNSGDVITALPKKGFVLEKKHHWFFHFWFKGKQTKFHTFVSGGKKSETVGPDNVRKMRLQLGLANNKQVHELVECSMDETAYITALQIAGNLPK